jgi:hypothetical protein
MESHDEERLMYKNLQFGNSDVSYSVQDLVTALGRIELTAAFFYTIPGPKMIWQFGEIGYDVSIDYNERVGNKPILWYYFEEANRRRLYDVIGALIHLRREHEVFSTDDFSWSLNNAAKRIKLNHATMNTVILGNFAVTQRDIDPQFQGTGWWYEYFSGDSLSANGVNDTISLQPGEYRIYTSKKLSKPDITEGIYSVSYRGDDIQLYPNPASDFLSISYKNTESEAGLEIFDVTGRAVLNKRINNDDIVEVAKLRPGLYIIKLRFKNSTYTDRLIVD